MFCSLLKVALSDNELFLPQWRRTEFGPGQELHVSVEDAKVHTMDQPALAALHVVTAFTTRQITNAYRVHEPASGLGLLATLVFATESNCWTASAHIVESLNGASALNSTSPLHRALERLGALLESRKGAAPVGAAKGCSM
jgi:hypothetical protein